MESISVPVFVLSGVDRGDCSRRIYAAESVFENTLKYSRH